MRTQCRSASDFYRFGSLDCFSMPRYRAQPKERPQTRSQVTRQRSRSPRSSGTREGRPILEDASPPAWAAGLVARVESLSAEVASLRAAQAPSGHSASTSASPSVAAAPASLPPTSTAGHQSWTTPALQPSTSAAVQPVDPSTLLSVLQQEGQPQATPELAAAGLLSAAGTTQPGMDLDMFVPAKAKELIWSGQYVDFCTLMPTFNKDSGDLQLRHVDGAVVLAPVRKSQPLSIAQWISAFSTFMSVYVAKHPEASVPLLKYMQIVRGIAQRGGDFRRYDEVFRQLMQSNPLPWNVVHSELFLQVCMPTPLSQPFRGTTPSVRQAPTTGRPGVPQVPRGYCFKFHSGRHCSGCSWKHNCFACGGAHSHQTCRKSPKVTSQAPRSSHPAQSTQSSQSAPNTGRPR